MEPFPTRGFPDSLVPFLFPQCQCGGLSAPPSSQCRHFPNSKQGQSQDCPSSKDCRLGLCDVPCMTIIDYPVRPAVFSRYPSEGESAVGYSTLTTSGVLILHCYYYLVQLSSSSCVMLLGVSYHCGLMSLKVHILEAGSHHGGQWSLVEDRPSALLSALPWPQVWSYRSESVLVQSAAVMDLTPL